MTTDTTPHSIEIEQALLGTFLTYTDSIKQAIEQGLMEDYFYEPTHKEIFKAMRSLNTKNSRTDVVTVMEELKEKKQLKNIGGVGYLTDLTATSGTKSNIDDYVGTLEDKLALRKLLDISNNLNYNILKSPMSSEELMAQAEKEILEITRSRRTTEFSHIQEVVPRLLEEIKYKSEQGTGITGLDTGFSDLNYITGGLQRGDLIIIGARPSVGKTAFALNLGKNMAEKNQLPTAIFSLEMPETTLVQRMISAHGGIKGHKLRDGKVKTNDDWNKLFEAANYIQSLPIVIDDSSNLKMSEVFSKCRKLKNEHGLGVVIIDYLQLMETTGKHGTRQEAVSQISRDLKGLARELDVPVIALSQLSRGVEHRESKRPMLSDLRESGSMEQDSDIVAFLYREEYHGEEEESDTQETQLIISKHRNGALGTVELMFEKSTNKFYDKSWRE